MENNRESILHQHAMEKEDLIAQYEKEKEELENQLSNLQRERDNSLLMAENDKQQVNLIGWFRYVGRAFFAKKKFDWSVSRRKGEA